MKRSLMKAGSRTVCLGLAALAAVCWSCTKEPAWDGDGSPQAEEAIAQARSYYESTAPPLTKSIGEQRIAIKPLPGEITPVWSQAKANVLSDGTTSWVDVPIEATITYTAVRGGVHDHKEGEACGHDHSAVQAVQKLTVYTAADGTQQSLIATIVPEPDCTAELRSFSSGTGLTGFSGFVSWHDLTGKLVRVAKYDNGNQTRSVEPTENNEKEILEVVDDAVLYPVDMADTPITRAAGDYCRLCNKSGCPEPNRMTHHCNMCNQYDPPGKEWESKCVCRPRCGKCGAEIPKGKDQCPGCSSEPVTDPFCKYCGILNCKTDHSIRPDNPIVPPPYVVQQEMLMKVLKYSVTQQQFSDIIEGTYLTDLYEQSQGSEHVHGLYHPTGDGECLSQAHAKMRDYFILNAQTFVYHDSYYHLGKALHPIIDTYVSQQTRVDMLAYYSYSWPQNIVNGSNVMPITSSTAPCAEAIKFIYTELMKLEGEYQNDAVGNVFDRWLQLTGGGY